MASLLVFLRETGKNDCMDKVPTLSDGHFWHISTFAASAAQSIPQ